ncbi:NMD3-domain-containing protein [Piedraia hortae CBS 480.64]|uniref:60S ribosomal export protein NMD3 n=1 Tax=Piedraia hortae CBS 480.64 TaxID=1314780 RepID=A0A6A7BVM0_9PEZI|nr:NMD3-domain-containing protein [Piedraia hortae CBS 480.64]
MAADSIPLPAPTGGAATILCHNCGAAIDGTQAPGALCADCLSLTVDITGGIDRDGILLMCRDCDRWLSPPSTWVVATRESPELLALCLRKLKGLHKSRIVDAKFIWTEPHSRRIKLELTVQQEVYSGTVLQQSIEVEYVQQYKQCPDCAKSYTHNTWRAVVQVRQKVLHKRTFLYLEQLILKQGAHKDTINIKEVHSGIDFYFAARNQAEKFVDFLHSVTPVRTKKSQELISADVHTSTKSYKFTFSCELVPLCKDDLVALPIPLARQLGNVSPLTLCYRVGTAVNLVDPDTLQTADLSAVTFWRAPFAALASTPSLVEFVVMDIEPTGPEHGRFQLADATVAKASDLGESYLVRTHLGAILNVGDSVMGYHLKETQFNHPEFEAILDSKKHAARVPDVVLVRKHYPARRKKKTRQWKLKRLGPETVKEEVDYEQFLQDLEADPELRENMTLYRNREAMEMEEDEEDGLTVPLEQLVDEVEDLTMEDVE